MRKIIILFMTVILLISGIVCGYAANVPQIRYESSYDNSTGLVSVTLLIDNAEGLEACDLNLAYDSTVFEYQKFVEITGTNMIAASGNPDVANAGKDKGWCSSSVMFMNSCTLDDCDENGTLHVVTFVLKPLIEKYDINDMYVWADSYSVNDNDIVEELSFMGNPVYSESHSKDTIVSTVTTKPSSESSKKESNSRWYVYVIFGVVAVAAIVGIALVASKHNDGNHDAPSENIKKEDESANEKENGDSSSDNN